MAVSVREERDPAFWQRVIEHPEVRHVVLGRDADLSAILSNPAVLPLASEHGGFLFVRLDGLGQVFELHTLFEPEGWGREAHDAAICAFREMFGRGAGAILTYETRHGQSKPPRSFGFRPVCEFQPSPIGEARTWLLTLEAWRQSPAWRRSCH